MNGNKYSIFTETLNASKKETAGKDKSNIIKEVEKTPELAPVNLYKEYHDDYSRHRDQHMEEENNARDNAPKSLHP